MPNGIILFVILTIFRILNISSSKYRKFWYNKIQIGNWWKGESEMDTHSNILIEWQWSQMSDDEREEIQYKYDSYFTKRPAQNTMHHASTSHINQSCKSELVELALNGDKIAGMMILIDHIRKNQIDY